MKSYYISYVTTKGKSSTFGSVLYKGQGFPSGGFKTVEDLQHAFQVCSYNAEEHENTKHDKVEIINVIELEDSIGD